MQERTVKLTEDSAVERDQRTIRTAIHTPTETSLARSLPEKKGIELKEESLPLRWIPGPDRTFRNFSSTKKQPL
jgi:hypothetical protein